MARAVMTISDGDKFPGHIEIRCEFDPPPSLDQTLPESSTAQLLALALLQVAANTATVEDVSMMQQGADDGEGGAVGDPADPRSDDA